MPFPSSFKSTLVTQRSPDDIAEYELLELVKNALLERGAEVTIIESEKLYFKVPFTMFPKGGNTNILVPVSSGSIQVEIREGKYLLSFCLGFRRLLILSLFIALGFIAPISLLEKKDPQYWLPLVAWLWLFGGNYLITAFRFPRFLKKSANRASV